MNQASKSAMIYLAIIVSFVGIISIFWYEEIRYALPTPIPKNYQEINLNTKLDLQKFVEVSENQPIFLHFFNPDCPCSRFNIDHFEELISDYGDKVQFYAVLQVQNKTNAIQQFKDKYELDVSVIVDEKELLAKYCGVYSTPQAVLLDQKSKLYYRGNYNRARYCTDPSTNYAQMAIDSILQNKPAPHFDKIATTSYGCELPSELKTWF